MTYVLSLLSEFTTTLNNKNGYYAFYLEVLQNHLIQVEFLKVWSFELYQNHYFYKSVIIFS